MSFLTDVYHKTLAENAKNMRFWEDYLQNLKSLDFNNFVDKLRVPIMVPVGSRILFKGELKHTNEITVALGSDYFVKCSVKQAEELRQHRIKDAEEKLQIIRKEREYMENQIVFKNENIIEKQGEEIIEVHSEEEDKAWREKHRENVRQWKQKKNDEDKSQEEITDEDLWSRLEELELQEELENELIKEESVTCEKNVESSFIVKEETIFEEKKGQQTPRSKTKNWKHSNKESTSEEKFEKKVKFATEETNSSKKYEILQKVIDKQSELEEKLLELQNKDSPQSRTEQDLIAKLDEIERLEEIEDEMQRLEDIIETEDTTTEEELDEDDNENSPHPIDPKRKVSFADEDDSETLELTFYHSDIEPCNEPYDPKKGIAKPSDVYEAFPSNFSETTSILKKTKYEDKKSNIQLPEFEKKVKKNVEWLEESDEEDNMESRTIVVKNVVEKVDVNENKLDGVDKRPISLFKQRRLQKEEIRKK